MIEKEMTWTESSWNKVDQVGGVVSLYSKKGIQF